MLSVWVGAGASPRDVHHERGVDGDVCFGEGGLVAAQPVAYLRIVGGAAEEPNAPPAALDQVRGRQPAACEFVSEDAAVRCRLV